MQTDKGAQEDFVARFSFPDNFSTNEQPFHVKISAMSVGGGVLKPSMLMVILP